MGGGRLCERGHMGRAEEGQGGGVVRRGGGGLGGFWVWTEGRDERGGCVLSLVWC